MKIILDNLKSMPFSTITDLSNFSPTFILYFRRYFTEMHFSNYDESDSIPRT